MQKLQVRRSWWRHHYLSAPGREAATFGRGGGAGGFKLKYSTKTKKKDTNDTNIGGDLTTNINTISQGAERWVGKCLTLFSRQQNK